jgi:hypothetical protein
MRLGAHRNGALPVFQPWTLGDFLRARGQLNSCRRDGLEGGTSCRAGSYEGRLLAPREDADKQTESKGNANGLIRTVANDFVGRFRPVNGLFLRTLNHRFQVIDQSFGDFSSGGGGT